MRRRPKPLPWRNLISATSNAGGWSGIEDEQARAEREPGIFNFHYQKMLSEYWIGGIYENFRTLRQRKLADTTPAFDQIFSDLESIRVPLEKHELPKDRSLRLGDQCRIIAAAASGHAAAPPSRLMPNCR
jgi:hypothetical protein